MNQAFNHETAGEEDEEDASRKPWAFRPKSNNC
jgi:hypothetical protein